MKFWEEVAEAGGVLDDFRNLIEIKNAITAPACKACTHTCCTSDQVGIIGYDSLIDRRLDKIRNDLRTFKPYDNNYCPFLFDKRCLIEDIKPPICINYWCTSCTNLIYKYNKENKDKIRFDEIRIGLSRGLYALAMNLTPTKHRGRPPIKDRPPAANTHKYYLTKLDEYITQSDTISKLLEEWHNLSYRLPPEQWYDHLSQAAAYYYSISNLWSREASIERERRYKFELEHQEAVRARF